MFRTLVLSVGLALSTPALACGGAPCGKACGMKHATDVDPTADVKRWAAGRMARMLSEQDGDG